VRQIGHVEAGVCGPGAEVRWQQGVGGLVGREVGGDVENHVATVTDGSAAVRAVGRRAQRRPTPRAEMTAARDRAEGAVANQR
jgi:hypothetical protein